MTSRREQAWCMVFPVPPVKTAPLAHLLYGPGPCTGQPPCPKCGGQDLRPREQHMDCADCEWTSETA